jgi:hypothetical protein
MPTAPFPNIRHWPMRYSSSSGQKRGRWLTHAGIGEFTVFIDLEVWPPKPVEMSNEYVNSFDVRPDGRLIVCSMITNPKSDYMIRVHAPGWPTKLKTDSPDIMPTPPPGGHCEVFTIGDRVLAFDSLIRKDGPPAAKFAYALKRARFQPAPSLPAVQVFESGDCQEHANGKVVLADGTEVLIWDGDGYELTRSSFKRTWDLGVKDNHIDWTFVPWGPVGFFYLSGRRVMFARRGEPPMAMLPDADNVMFLSPGPEDSVVVNHGTHKKGLATQVWFPKDGSFIPIARGDLGISGRSSPGEVYWSAATKHFYTKYADLVTFPDSDLLARKRVRARGPGYILSLAK